MIVLVTACSGGGSTATPTITSFVSSSVTIIAGSSVNLTAVFANGSGSIDNGVGNVYSNVPKSVTPSSTNSVGPPTGGAITGIPKNIASRMVSPKVSII